MVHETIGGVVHETIGGVVHETIERNKCSTATFPSYFFVKFLISIISLPLVMFLHKTLFYYNMDTSTF